MARRPLTDRQREIGSARRAHAAMQQTNVATHQRTAEIDTTQIAAREAIHTRQRVATESELAAGRRNRAITGSAVSTITPSSDSNLIMTTLFVMFGLIIMYLLVTNPGPTTGWLSTLSTGLHALSSNKPLFVTTAK